MANSIIRNYWYTKYIFAMLEQQTQLTRESSCAWVAYILFCLTLYIEFNSLRLFCMSKLSLVCIPLVNESISTRVTFITLARWVANNIFIFKMHKIELSTLRVKSEICSADLTNTWRKIVYVNIPFSLVTVGHILKFSWKRLKFIVKIAIIL